MKTAIFVKSLIGFSGEARLYRCDPPMEGHEYVVVSATGTFYGVGPETYIFPGDANGEVTDWGELDGSFRGGFNHEQALSNAGYDIIERKENK